MVWIIYQCPYGWGLISRMVGDVFAGIRFVAVPIAVNDNIRAWVWLQPTVPNKPSPE